MRHYLTLFSWLIGLTVSAQAPQPVPFEDLMHARYDAAYYAGQADLWQAAATAKRASEDAWLQYYLYAVQANRQAGEDHDLTGLRETARQALNARGFVWNFLDYLSDDDPLLRWPKLLRAYAAGPDRPEIYPAMISYYEMLGDEGSRNALLQKMLLEHPLPAGVMDYNYNQLQSVGEGGVLVTHGPADTYPSWLLQVAYGVRPDVTVVSLPLFLEYDAYANRILANVGANFFGIQERKVRTRPARPAADVSAARQRQWNILARINRLASRATPVYVAVSGKETLEALPASQLYLTGLAFRYTEDPFNNLQSIIDAYRRFWRTESFRQPLDAGAGQRVADQLNRNYLPALLELYDNRRRRTGISGDELLPAIQNIARRAGIAAEVADYLRAEVVPRLASAAPGITAKEIIKGYTLLMEEWKETKYRKHTRSRFSNLAMGKTEVSNADYRRFLADLERQGLTALLDSVALAEADYPALLGDGGRTLSPATLRKAGLPTDDNHPVTNVSPQAARLYASWLTQVYNQDPKRKNKNQVVFRLPTRDEFEYAARGGRKHAPYPWGGPYIRNMKGCLLANFNTLSPEAREDFERYQRRVARGDYAGGKKQRNGPEPACSFDDDGGLLTVAVDAYYPNDYGLYNMAGNAAEMTDEDGKTMGGSWLDAAGALRNGVVTERTLPHPSTGFRLVVELVE